MEYQILKRIPVQTLNEFLKYKFNPIICYLTISLHDGIAKDVTFLINNKIGSLLSNEDYIEFNNIILNTQFKPDDSYNHKTGAFYWAITRKQIKGFLKNK